MNLLKKVNALCKPSYVYLMISIVALSLVVVQNLINGNMKELCIGTYSCNVPNVVVLCGLKVMYIVFWTVVLDAFCKYGLKQLSWFMVLFPLVLSAVMVGLMMVNSNTLLI